MKDLSEARRIIEQQRGEIESLKAKLAEAEKDAGRYRYIKGLARKSEAYDRFTGYHWQIGFYDPKCVGFDSAIDAMIRGRA